ncbi:nucleoside phosphorylase [Lacticaseibacillus suihuaensis]
MLLDEFDSDRTAIIGPEHVGQRIPEAWTCDTAILFFSRRLLAALLAQGRLRIVGELSHEPVYRFDLADGRAVLLRLAHVGAPACVSDIEELGAQGVRHFVVMGSCGVLAPTQAADEIVLPVRALRDEGTSYHYSPSGDAMIANPEDVAVMTAALEAAGFSYTATTTWTTDAFFRETRAKLARRTSQGATVVDMESSALMAVCQWRGYHLYQFFYTADALHPDGWAARKDQRLRGLDDFFALATQIAQRVTGLG